MNHLLLGIDIGGSHISSSIVDISNNSLIESSWSRLSVDSKGTVEEIIGCWSTAIKESCQRAGKEPAAIGIAMPGPMDYEAGISLMHNNDKYESLYQLNVKELLGQSLGIENDSIVLLNDASAFVYGEAEAGSGKGLDKVIGITLGTGFGAAKYENGVSEDLDLWQMPFKDSIAEEFVATRWFVRYYAELTGEEVPGVKELADMYDTSADARKVFETFAGNLTEILLQIYHQYHPEVIVIGGNIGNAAPYYLPQVQHLLKDQNVHVPVLRDALGEMAPIIGAANYCAQKRQYK